MRVPRFWARVSEGGRCCLGWSDQGQGDAERVARERLGRLLARGEHGAGEWDYYPSTPVREEILERPSVPGLALLITRNRAGATVLNADRAAFVDVDLPRAKGALRSSLLGSLFGRKARGEEPAAAALARAREWATASGARLRAYRTARGLRLLRLDALVDPAGDECQAMFAALGADPQYRRLCRLQASFRARLSPKPNRVGCAQAPGSHPRSERPTQEAFRIWLARYEEACRGHAACAVLEELGPGRPLPALASLAALHDRQAVRAGTLA